MGDEAERTKQRIKGWLLATRYTVRDYLVSRGVNTSRLQTVSYGEERPKHDNAREETRRLNRRAALMIRLQ